MDEIFTGFGGVHKTHSEFISASSDIFHVPPREKATEYSRESIHRPTSENADGPFDFFLPAEGETYVDPDGFRLSGYTRLVKIGANGETEELKATDDVAPINFVCGMAFQTKELSIQGALVNYATQPLDNLKA